MKINWIQKLTSRKFWAAIVGFITAILVALNYSDMEIGQVAAIITAGGTLIAYICAEGAVDKAAISSSTEKNSESEEK